KHAPRSAMRVLLFSSLKFSEPEHRVGGLASHEVPGCHQPHLAGAAQQIPGETPEREQFAQSWPKPRRIFEVDGPESQSRQQRRQNAEQKFVQSESPSQNDPEQIGGGRAEHESQRGFCPTSHRDREPAPATYL